MPILIDRDNDQNGFTLIELIVVMVILAVVAMIAVPRYTKLLDTNIVYADATSAAGIASAARMQETAAGIRLNGLADLTSAYIHAGTPRNGDAWALTGGGDSAYVVTWTPASGTYQGKVQTVTEGSKFDINTE